MATPSIEKLNAIRDHIDSYPDFPKPGILFRDVFSVLKEPVIFEYLCDLLYEHVQSITPPIECVVGIEARGFLFGPILARDLKVPFVPIRKKGKLPGETKSFKYILEYGEDILEIQANTIHKGERVLIIDDLLATGGSMNGAYNLLKMMDAEVIECLVIIELVDLKGRDKLQVSVHSLLKY